MNKHFNLSKAFFCAALAAVCSISAASCGGTPIGTTDRVVASDSSATAESSAAEAPVQSMPDSENEASSSLPEKPSGTATAHFVCAGDNLIHDNIYIEALEKGGGSEYDFSSCYEHIKKYINGADVAVLNQETLVTDYCEPSSYPTFATPTALGDEVVDDIGFNVISMSNNHVLDKGEEGLISSLDYWASKDVVCYGAYRSQEDSEAIRTLTVNDITFAFLGYMEHTNGLSLSGEGAKVVYLSDENTIKRQIEEADKLADVVVVSCHYGTEIQNELNDQQITLTPKLVEWGADLIIGTQAHTISSCGYIDKPDGGQAFVYYGLGNFISTMYDTKSLVGIIGDLDVVKNYDTGEITFENVKAIPIISHFEAQYYNSNWYNCTVYPYAEYTDELFAENFVEGFTRESAEKCLSYIPNEFLSIE
ncbi:CapA family protein [Ruminococcus sp. Marseille-P6503]|uniref:CapA family protein n=1 Tax=Ruminococcus sp. Marseille-P6503 TaxID=2364796 RepID=UPI000F52B60B|nr:CapA family protein [Ruminococcus sp. Marseille-P6503]